MLKVRKILNKLVLLFILGACSSHLSSEDRAVLTNIQNTAEEAKSMSLEALEESRNATVKAERIFKQSQKK